MPNEQTLSTKTSIVSEETDAQGSQSIESEQIQSEENGSISGKTNTEQVDNFAQMYDMLTERDTTIKNLKEEVANLKKSNTELLLKVNASASSGAPTKNPYEKFIDAMVSR